MTVINNVHDKVFTCPKCGNKTLIPVEKNDDIIGIGFHDLCICEECASELYSEPQCDFSVKFVEMNEEELEKEHYNNAMNMSYKNRAKV